MKRLFKPLYWMAGLLLATATIAQSSAQAPADAPAGSAGRCKDGTYSSAVTKKGACSGHQGIHNWWGATTASPTTGATAAAASSAPAAAPAAASAKSVAPKAPIAPGGVQGQVWVNSGSKVYHCPGDAWYGNTKLGQYMSEADAKAAGNRPAHGKSCT
jgi:hypothetical protein